MDDDRKFPLIDADRARGLLAVAYQAIQDAIDLNTRLAVHLDAAADKEAHRLSDAIFVTLNDAKQRIEEIIGALG